MRSNHCILCGSYLFFLHFTFPLIDFFSQHLTCFDRVHIDLDIIVEDDCRSFFTSALTEAVFDNQFFRIIIKYSIRSESFLDKARKSLSTWASFTYFDREWRHVQDYRDRESKGKLKLNNLRISERRIFRSITNKLKFPTLVGLFYDFSLFRLRK